MQAEVVKLLTDETVICLRILARLVELGSGQMVMLLRRLKTFEALLNVCMASPGLLKGQWPQEDMHALCSQLKGPQDCIVLYLGDGYEGLLRDIHASGSSNVSSTFPASNSTWLALPHSCNSFWHNFRLSMILPLSIVDGLQLTNIGSI